MSSTWPLWTACGNTIDYWRFISNSRTVTESIRDATKAARIPSMLISTERSSTSVLKSLKINGLICTILTSQISRQVSMPASVDWNWSILITKYSIVWRQSSVKVSGWRAKFPTERSSLVSSTTKAPEVWDSSAASPDITSFILWTLT